MVQNRFYVHPGGDIGTGLAGLGETIQRGMAIKGARDAKQRAAEETARVRTAMMTAMQSGNEDDLEKLFVENPELAMAVRKFKGLEDDSARGTLEEELSQKMIAGDIESGRELLSLNPERFGKIKKAMTDPDAKDTRTPAIKNYEYAKDQGFTGSLLDFQALGKDKDGRTSEIKNFEYGEKNPKFALKQLKTSENKKTKDILNKTYKHSTDLRKEFVKQSTDYKKVRDAYTRVIGSTKDPSPAGDLSLIFNYMKMLDPGSVVRESEFATAAASGSYGDRMQASVQKVLSGERLSPKMRKDFLDKSRELLKGMAAQHKKREGSYREIASKNNLPVDEVVIDLTIPDEQESYADGTTATGPGGEKIIYRNGRWENM